MRNARLRHSQSESWRRIGNYVAKPGFFYEDFGSSILSLSLTLNVEPGTCERLCILRVQKGITAFIPMPRCNHQSLVLLTPKDKKLRCRHCHLTIDEEELADDYCPECYEVYGVKRRDFDQLEPEDKGKTQYRCEECGIIIKC